MPRSPSVIDRASGTSAYVSIRKPGGSLYAPEERIRSRIPPIPRRGAARTRRGSGPPGISVSCLPRPAAANTCTRSTAGGRSPAPGVIRTLCRYPSFFFRSAATNRTPETFSTSAPTRLTIAASFFGLTVRTVPKAGIPSSAAFLAVSSSRNRTHASQRRPRSGSPSRPRTACFPVRFPAASDDQGKGGLLLQVEGGLHPFPVLFLGVYVRVIKEAGDVEKLPQGPHAVGRVRGAADVEEDLFPAGDVGKKHQAPEPVSPCLMILFYQQVRVLACERNEGILQVDAAAAVPGDVLHHARGGRLPVGREPAGAGLRPAPRA